MIFYDTETCGFHGPIVLMQYAEDKKDGSLDSEIKLYCPWNQPVRATMELIEWMMNHEEGVCGFNLAFDHFHLCQMYTTLKLLDDNGYGNEILDSLIEEYAECEPLARDGPCLKPQTACDVMLVARRGPYQSTMDRGDIRIRRVPTVLAFQLAKELDRRIPLKDIYFARKKNKERWQVYDITDSEKNVNPDFKDVVLKFAPSAALKALAVDALGIKEDDVLRFMDVNVAKVYQPVEKGWAPFAKAIGNRFDWKGTWPSVIKYHISHWLYHPVARKYASKDVEYTRDLYKHFGSPEPGDNDSILACCVGAVRWKGYKIDIPAIQRLRAKTFESNKVEYRGQMIDVPTAPKAARFYIGEVLNVTEEATAKLERGTGKEILKELAELKTDCDCVIKTQPKIDPKASYAQQMEAMMKGPTVSDPNPNCSKCQGKGVTEHPAAIRAKHVLNARMADKERELYDKLLQAGRFHADFNVIGALSTRMSGSGGLNAQGVKKTEEVRSCFPFAFDDFILSGGDYSAFEVCLAEALYNDPKLRASLLTGKKIHGLFGVHVYIGKTYEEIVASEKTKEDMYTGSKRAVFLMLYGGQAKKLANALGVPIEVAERAIILFHKEYPGVKIAQQRVIDWFCSMKQVGGIGSRIVWKEPKQYIESMFGFKRYFHLENEICRALFQLANNPPKEWKHLKVKLVRRDREQTASGAVQSSLFGAAFQIQAANTRAAINHEIQSSGAQITKDTQCKVWEFQPKGIHDWHVIPCNIHDEIMCPLKPELAKPVKEAVAQVVEKYKPRVPLIKIDWVEKLENWAQKG